MDAQDHKKSPSSGGHEGHGVHLCHKCGWPFPNPHPSAKHRRAHKRVCGKVEGYKIIGSENDHISDDEHLSDDDSMKTPSPKVEKGSVKEAGSSDGIGLKSIKSEDDVFSDAVTEFSDSGVSPGAEERLESVRELDKSVGGELVHELNDSQKSKDDGVDDTTKQLDDLTTGSEISNAEAVGSVINQSESTKPVTDNRVEEVSFEFDQTDDQKIDASPTVVETISEDINANAEGGKQKEIISSKPETDLEGKEIVSESVSFTESVALLSNSAGEAPLSEPKSEDAEGGGSGPVVLESIVPEADRKVSNTVTMEPKLYEADGNISHAIAVDEIVEEKKEPSNKLEAGIINVSTGGEIAEQEKELSNVLHSEIKHDLSPQIEPPKCTDTSVTTQVEAEITNVSTRGEIAEQEKELSNVLHSETKHDLSPQIEPPKCTDTSVTTQVEADSAKDTIRVGHDKLAEAYALKEGGDREAHLISVAETLPALENPEIITGEFKDYKVLKSSFPLDLGDAEITSSVEDDNKVNLSEPDPSSASSIPVGSLGTSHSDFNSLEDSHGKEGVLPHTGGEVDISGLRVIGEEGSGANGLEGSSGTSGVETRSIEGFQPNSADEESSQDGVSAPSSIENFDVIHTVSSIDEEKCRQTTNLRNLETADDTVTTKSYHVRTENGTNHSLDEGNTSSSKKCTDEVCVEASQGIEIGKNTEGQWLGDAFGVDPASSPEGHSRASGNPSENSKEMETQRPIAAVSQLKPEDHGEVSDKNSEDSKEAAVLPVASTTSSQSSAIVEGKITGDAGTSEPLLDDGDAKLTKESLNVSSGRTESLDGNWGSVSVLSTQSDGTALTDAEALSSGGIQAPEKSEGTLLKLQTAEECHADNSDAFEPPSFMTLVESGPEDDKKVAAASEIHDVQKTEPPKSEASKAGWFPSLTNVVNESEGRKKNEEIIAKVTNWSTGKQHSPLKNLLSEAQAETKVKPAAQKQVPSTNQGSETASKNNGAAVTTVSSIIGSETPGDNAAKREMEKEWNSPARYPAEIKKEKKKGKPYWVPFVCCASVHQDM